jgi:hypothetical protein
MFTNYFSVMWGAGHPEEFQTDHKSPQADLKADRQGRSRGRDERTPGRTLSLNAPQGRRWRTFSTAC